MSSSSGSGSHGGGWMSWVIPAVLIAYAIAVVWAASVGLSPWVFVYGTLGAFGIGWFGYHMGHVVGHALHSPVANIIVVALGCWAAYAMVLPVIEWRSTLSGPEMWCDLTLGSVGILFLAYELGHLLHHSHGWQTVIGLLAVALVVGLYITRPPGAVLAPVPPVAARPMPPRSTGLPGFGGVSSGGSSVTTPAVTASGGALDCSRLSPRARQAAGCR